MKQIQIKIVSALSSLGLLASMLFCGSAYAGGTPSIYLTPTLGTYQVGSTIIVSVRENSGTTPIVKVIANIDFPSNVLEYQSVSSNTSAFDQENFQGGDQTGIKISRSNSSNVTGDQMVGTISFKVIGAGTATLTVAAGSNTWDAAGNFQDPGYGNASYSLVSASTPAPTLVPATPHPATPKPVVTTKTPSPSATAVTPTPTMAASAPPKADSTQSKSTPAGSNASKSFSGTSDTILGMTKTAAIATAGSVMVLILVLLGLFFWIRKRP